MVVSTPPSERTPQVTVYGIDPQLWRLFRSWCVARGYTTGDGITYAIRAVMRPDWSPETSDARNA